MEETSLRSPNSSFISSSSNGINSNSSSSSSSNLVEITNSYRLIEYYIVCGLNRSIVIDQIEKPFQVEILERYPIHNHEQALPPHIWMFCFPNGLYIRDQELEPTLSTFCLTELDGSRFYAASLVYYQKIPPDHIDFKDKKVLYSPVSISLLSRFPCYYLLRELLCYFYCIPKEHHHILPFERLVSNVVNDLPKMISGYEFTYVAPPLLSHPLKPFKYGIPAQPMFPQVDINFSIAFNILGIQNVLKIFSLALLERRLLFLSSNQSLLTIACESISHLLYPFNWPHVYIPILPNILIDFLQAPTPLIVGMYYNDKRPFQLDNNDITIINLDQQTITIPPNITPPTLPDQQCRLLQNRLQDIIYPDISNISIAFPSQPPKWSKLPNLDNNDKIRAAFLDFFLSFFYDVNSYRYLLRKYPKPITSFNTASFLMKHQDTEVVNFLTDLIETSAVTTFLDQNQENTSFFNYICQLNQIENAYAKIVLNSSSSNGSSNNNLVNGNSTTHVTYFETILSHISKVKSNPEFESIEIPTLDDTNTDVEGKPLQPSYTYTDIPEMTESLYSLRTPFSKQSANLKPRRPSSQALKPVNGSSTSPSASLSSSPSTSFIKSLPSLSSSPGGNSADSSFRRGSLLKSLPQSTIILANYNNGNQQLASSTSSSSSTSSIGNGSNTGGNNSNEDNEVLRDFIERYIELIFDDTEEMPINIEQQNLLLDVFAIRKSRIYFVESLAQLNSKKLALQFGSWRLFLFIEVIKKVFNECDRSADFKTASTLLNRIKEFYFQNNTNQEPLYVHFINLSLWKNIHFWESSFFDSVQVLRKEKLTSTFNDFGHSMENFWDSQTPEKQKIMIETEEDILFTSLSSYAYQMIKLKVSPVATAKFIGKMSMLTSLSDEHTQTLVELIDKIHKAHTMEVSTGGTVASNITIANNVDTSFNKSDIKYFTASVRRNIEIEKDGAKQIYTKLIESTRNTKGNHSDRNSNDKQPKDTPIETVSERKDGYTVTTLKGSKAGISTMAIHSNPKSIITGDLSGAIMIWNYEDGQFQQRLTNHKDSVTCIGIGDFDVFSSGSRDKTLRIWNYGSGEWKCTSTLQEHTAEISCLEMKRNVVLTGSYDYSMILWDVRTNRKIKSFNGHKQHLLSIALGGIGGDSMAVTTSSDTTARVWDLRTMKCLHVLKGHNDWVGKAVLDGDGNLFTASYDGLIKIWDINSGTLKRNLAGHKGNVSCLTYNSAHSNTLLSAGEDCLIRAWDLKTGVVQRVYKGHKDEVKSVLFEEDVIVSTSSDLTIRVWNAQSTSCNKVLRGHNDWVRSLATPKHAQSLSKFVTTGLDATVKIWEMDPIIITQPPSVVVTQPMVSSLSASTSSLSGHKLSSKSFISQSTSSSVIPIQHQHLSASGEIIISGSSKGSSKKSRHKKKASFDLSSMSSSSSMGSASSLLSNPSSTTSTPNLSQTISYTSVSNIGNLVPGNTNTTGGNSERDRNSTGAYSNYLNNRSDSSSSSLSTSSIISNRNSLGSVDGSSVGGSAISLSASSMLLSTSTSSFSSSLSSSSSTPPNSTPPTTPPNGWQVCSPSNRERKVQFESR